MEKARCNTELYSNLSQPLNNFKPSNFLGSHHFQINDIRGFIVSSSKIIEGSLDYTTNLQNLQLLLLP